MLSIHFLSSKEVEQFCTSLLHFSLCSTTACTCSRRCSELTPCSCSHSRSNPSAWAAPGCDTPSSPRSPPRGSCQAGPGPSQTSQHSHCDEATTTHPDCSHCGSPELNSLEENSFRQVVTTWDSAPSQNWPYSPISVEANNFAFSQ